MAKVVLRPRDLKCYCCGVGIVDSFALVSMADETDRLFVMTVAHAERAKDLTLMLIVKPEEDHATC